MTPRQGNTIPFGSSQQLPPSLARTIEGFLSWHGTFQGPFYLILHISTGLNYSYYDTGSVSSLAGYYAGRQQDSVKNNWRKPWMCVCQEHTCFHLSIKLRGLGPPWPPLTSLPLLPIKSRLTLCVFVWPTCVLFGHMISPPLPIPQRIGRKFY